MATTEFSRMGPAPRLYNDPDLSPLEFLHAVYHDPRRPIQNQGPRVFLYRILDALSLSVA